MDSETYQSLLLILGVIAFVVLIIYEKINWTEFYGGSQSNIAQVTALYSFLKRNGVKCKLKTKNQGFSRMQTSQMVTAVIEVKKSDEDEANRLLNEFHRR